MSEIIEAEELQELHVELSIENMGWGAMLLKEMDVLREKKEQCDIAVMVIDGTQVPAHSVVLSAASPFFKQVFETAKSTNPSACNVVIKCQYTQGVIRSVFDFLYRGQVMPLLSQIPEIQRAAKTFGIETLATLCQVFTTQNLFPGSNQNLVFQEGESPYTELTQIDETSEEFYNGVNNCGTVADIPQEDSEIPTEACSDTIDQPVEDVTLVDSETWTTLEDEEVPLEEISTNTHVLDPEIIKQNVAEEYDVKTSYPKVYRYKCDLCERVFTSRCRLAGHRATHSGEKLHVCKICGAEFIQIEYLREHQSVHNNAKPYKCTFCNLKFRLLRHLKKHSAIHSNRKPFKCNTCGAAFRRSDGWRNHLRTHTGEKPYPCNLCGRIFSLAESLKRHEVVHTGKRPFTCGICSATFKRNDALRKHLTIHSSERPFVCKHIGCVSSFRMKVQLNRHNRIFHSKDKAKADTRESMQFSIDHTDNTVIDSQTVDINEQNSPENTEIDSNLHEISIVDGEQCTEI